MDANEHVHDLHQLTEAADRIERLLAPRFKIIDTATGKRVTICTYSTETQAANDIDSWLARHHRGGRPDITLEMIQRMRVAPEDHDYS